MGSPKLYKMFLYQEQKCKSSFCLDSANLEEEKERTSLINRILHAKSTFLSRGEQSGGKVQTRYFFLIA